MPIKVHKFSPQPKLPAYGGSLFNKYKRLWEDEEYAKLQAEQARNIQELGEDTATSALAQYEQGIEATPEVLYETGTQLYEFGAELFGDDETKYDARRARAAAEELSAQTKEELLEGIPGGPKSDFAYELGSTLAQEAPFIAASGGTSLIAKAVGKQIVKKGIARRMGKEALEKVPTPFRGPVGYVPEKELKDAVQERAEEIAQKAAMRSMALIHGSRSAGGTFTTATDKRYKQIFPQLKAKNPDMPLMELDQMAYEQARSEAVAPSIASGVITAGLISALGPTGVERFFATPLKSRPAMMEFLSAFGMEATEEGADQFLQGVLAKHTYDPTKSWDSIINETTHSMLLGGLIGVKFGGFKVATEKGFDFIDQGPITQRLARWAESKSGSGRINDREGILQWIKDHSLEVKTDEEAEAVATAINDGIETIKSKLNKEAQGTNPEDAEAEARREQRVPEEELEQLEEEGVNVTPERDKQDDLSVHRSRGKAAQEEGLENPQEEAGRIQQEESVEAAEQFVEGYNESAITQEDSAETGSNKSSESAVNQEAAVSLDSLETFFRKKGANLGRREVEESDGNVVAGKLRKETVQNDQQDVNWLQLKRKIRKGVKEGKSADEIAQEVYSHFWGFENGILSGAEIQNTFLKAIENEIEAEGVLSPEPQPVIEVEPEVETEQVTETKPDPNQGDFMGLMTSPAVENTATTEAVESGEVEERSMDLFENAQRQVVNSDREVTVEPVEGRQRELELAELPEGEERGRVDLPPRPPEVQGPPAPDPQTELQTGEEVDYEYKRIQDEETKEAPEGQVVLSRQRPSREGKSHYDKADGHWAEDYIYVGKNFTDNGREVILKHNQNTDTIDIGFFNETGRFVPTHRLKDYSQVKESKQKRKNTENPRAFFIPKAILSDKNLTNQDVWEIAPNSPIRAAFEKEKAAVIGEQELARRVAARIEDPSLRESLQLLVNSDQLGGEGVNAVILAANKYRPEGSRTVNPRALSKRGDVDRLAKELEKSLKILKNKELFSESLLEDGDSIDPESLATLNIDARTDLTSKDLKLVDKGRADEEMPVADWTTVPNGQTVGFKAAVTKGKKGLAPIVFKTQTESKGVTVNRVEVGLVNPERIPLDQLQSNLNEVYKGKGVEFSINRSGAVPTISVSGKTEVLTDEAVEGIQGIIAYVNMKAKKAPVTKKYQKVIAKQERISRENDIRETHGSYSPKGVKTKQRKRRGKAEEITENDKKILKDGGAVLDYWTKKGDESPETDQLTLEGKQPFKNLEGQSLLAPSVLNDQAAARITAYNQNKNNRDNQLLLSYKEKKDKPAPRITTLNIEKGQLDEGVERYVLDGRNVYIIKDKKSGDYYYTIGAAPSPSNPVTAMPRDTVRKPEQAKNYLAAKVNDLNRGLKFAGLSVIIGKSQDAKNIEQQQRVGLDALEKGQTFAATPTSLQDIEEGRAETPKDEEAVVEDMPVEDQAQRSRWRSKLQPSDPMPQVEGVAPQGEEQVVYPEGEVRSGYVKEGNRVFPANKQFDNEFRASIGLAPVTKVPGGYALPSRPLELTKEQKDPMAVPYVGERYTRIMEGEQEAGVTQRERMEQAELPPRAQEEQIELTPEEFNTVQAHIDSVGGKQAFLNQIADLLDKNPNLVNPILKLAEQATKAARGFAAQARAEAAKIQGQSPEAQRRKAELIERADLLEQGMPYDFKSVLGADGRKMLTAWAKSVSPNNHKAVVEYAEDILREIEPNKRLRSKGNEAEAETVQVPNDIPTAKGAVGLKELISRADNGLTEEQRIAALRFLDKISPELLENLSLNISSELNTNGDTEVAYEGEFNSLENIINLASDTDTDPNTLLEEIAHFTAKLLPSDLRQDAIKLHKKALTEEITKNERELEQADGADRLRILSNLNVLRSIQSRGQLTSNEFRSILPKEAEVGSDTFERIIQDTYHLANADEFYANAMVTRVGESEFGKARQFLNNILDAIAAAFGNTNAQVNRFVRNAQKVLATPGRANKKLGGMLMRDNITAKSMKVLTNPGSLAGTVATDISRSEAARETGNISEADKLKQRADDKLAQAGAITSVFDKVLRKLLPSGDIESRIAKLVKMTDIGYIADLVDSMPDSSEFIQTIQRFKKEGRPELADATSLYTLHFILEMQNRATRLRNKADAQMAKVSSKTFQAAIKRAAKDAKKSDSAAILRSEIVSSLKVALESATSPKAETSLLAGMIGSLEALESAVSTVPELTKAMTTLANILGKTPEGLELFNRPDINEQFKDSDEIVRLSNEVFEYIKSLGVDKKDENLWRTASALFVANKSIRTNAVIESIPFFDARKDVDKTIKEVEEALSASPEERSKKIAEIFDSVVDLSSEEGRLRYVAQERMKSVLNQLQWAADLDQAATLAEKVMTDPEVVEYRRIAGIEAKADDRPELVEESFFEDFQNGQVWIPVPPDKLDPDKPNVIKVSLVIDESDKSNKNLKTIHDAALDIQRWLDQQLDEGGGQPSSPYFNYYWNTLQQLHATYVNELVWNTSKNERGLLRSTFFGVLGHMIDNVPTQAAKVARRFIDKHDRYYTWFDDWRARHKAKWANLLMKAARSRKGRFADDTSFSLRESKAKQKARGVHDWERTIGRYLRDSWQEDGLSYEAGEILPNGEIVTQADIDLIKFESEITSEAFQFNEMISEFDESMQPIRVTDIKNIKRLPLKRGKAMLPRRFSQDGRHLISRYSQTSKVGSALFDEVFSGEDGKQALISFITDRDPEWITGSGVDASINERAYAQVVEEIRTGSLADIENGEIITSDMVAERLAEMTGEGVITIKEQMMNEFAPVLDNLKEKFNPENRAKNPFIQISKTEGLSPLTEARRDKIAPTFFYSLGYNHEVDFQSFISHGQLPAALNVTKALQSTVDELDILLAKSGGLYERAKALAKERGVSVYNPAIQKQVAKEIGVTLVGDGLLYDELWNKRELILKYISDFDQVYGNGFSDYTTDSMPGLGRRAWGATVGAILGNTITTMRNATETLINGALAVQMVQGGMGIAPIAYTILRGLMVNALKLGGSFVVSAGKIATYKLPIIGTWKALKRGTGLDGHPPSLYGAVRALLIPTVEELANVLPGRTKEYQMLARQGLGMPTTPEQTSINFDEFLETGGRIMPYESTPGGSQSILKSMGGRLVNQLVGTAEAGVQVLLQPLMQRLGDVGANNLLATLAQHVGHNMERKARIAYNRRVKAGIPIDENVAPEELLGNFLGILKQNKVTYNEARTFLGKAGITNLEQQAQDFWRKLATAPDKAARKNIRMFNQKQLDSMAATLVMANNIATPSNRPLWQKKSAGFAVMFALTGWSFNQLQNWAKMTSRTKDESRSEAYKRRVQMLMLFLAPVMFSIPDNWLLEWMSRWSDDLLYGKRRITRLPTETAGWQQPGVQWDESKAFLSLATQSIPLVGSSLNALWNDLPGRAQHAPANLMLSQVKALANVGIQSYQTKSLRPALENLQRLLPISRAVTYRISKYQQNKTKNDNAKRAIRATYADQQAVEPIRGGEMGSKLDEFSPYRQEWAAAVAGEDWAEADRLYNDAIEVYGEVSEKRTGRKLSRKDIERNLRSSLSSANPIAQALRYKPSRKNFFQNIEHATEDDKNYIIPMVALWEKAHDRYDFAPIFSSGKSSSRVIPKASSRRRTSGRRALRQR